MVDKKITELDEATSLVADDIIPVTVDTSGSAVTKKVKASNFVKYINFDTSTTTLGCDQNRDTGSAYSYTAQRVRILRPVKLDAVLWDIKSAGDYTLTVRDCEQNILYTKDLAGISAESEDVVFEFSEPVLAPGVYWFRMTCSSSVTWHDYNVSTDQHFSAFEIIDQADYGGTLSNYRSALKLKYYDSA